jgi:hypothetical protein
MFIHRQSPKDPVGGQRTLDVAKNNASAHFLKSVSRSNNAGAPTGAAMTKSREL